MTGTLKSAGAVLAARRGVRRLSDASVEITSPLRMTPHFLICGAQRCGTTSMFKTIVQHPGVARPFLRKGVHYFDKHYDRGAPWYRGHFPITMTSRLRRRGAEPLTGESSPYYMFDPRAGERIARDLPGVKLIVLLRDPAVRAYSAHSHELAKGFETLPFEEALEREPERTAGERERMVRDDAYQSFDLQHHSYLARGHYIDQLIELERHVGRERLLVVDSGDFFIDPEPVFDEVCRFLGLPPAEGITFERHNARQRSPLTPALEARLRDHFAPYDARLTDWWGVTPSWLRG